MFDFELLSTGINDSFLVVYCFQLNLESGFSRGGRQAGSMDFRKLFPIIIGLFSK